MQLLIDLKFVLTINIFFLKIFLYQLTNGAKNLRPFLFIFYFDRTLRSFFLEIRKKEKKKVNFKKKKREKKEAKI